MTITRERERLGFDPPLRHWIFQSIGTHLYIWHPIMGFINLFVGQSLRTHFPQRGLNVMVDSCLGGLAVMTLIQNARDWGSIPCWGTEFFSPSEPNVTIETKIICTKLKKSTSYLVKSDGFDGICVVEWRKVTFIEAHPTPPYLWHPYKLTTLHILTSSVSLTPHCSNILLTLAHLLHFSASHVWQWRIQGANPQWSSCAKVPENSNKNKEESTVVMFHHTAILLSIRCLCWRNSVNDMCLFQWHFIHIEVKSFT